VQLILIGGLTAALRWTLTSFDPPFAALFVLQLTHGLTFGGTYLGTMIFMTRAFPPHVAATVQGLSSSFSAGVAIGSAYLAAGPLYRAFGAGAYLSMAGLAVVAVALTLALKRRWDGGLLG
jgi:PPP family 3-phenylpropionic acid transporter